MVQKIRLWFHSVRDLLEFRYSKWKAKRKSKKDPYNDFIYPLF